MAGLVDIVLPSGEAATVPEQDLPQALAAGATRPAADTGPDDGGAIGKAAAGIFGAGSTATFGLADVALNEGSYILGGKDFQKEVLGNVKQVREANPYSTMAGEAAGLFLNPSLAGVGEGVEGAVASRLGHGLLGDVASMGARGAAEGFALGAQKQITEDALGDHGYNGEAIFASGAKDALLGGAIGAPLGVASYGLKQTAGLLRRSPGPAADAVLDEIAGVQGAGRKLAEEARAAEKVVEDLRKTGLPSEEAARLADDIKHAAKLAADEAPQASAAGIQFVPHPGANKSYTTVMVDANALDQAWKKDVGFYIGKGEEGIPGRRDGVERFLQKGEPLQASRVTVDKDGRAAFVDGRHRFATLRDQGVDRVAITIPKADLKRLPVEWNVGALNAVGEAAGAAPSGGIGSSLLDDIVGRYAAQHPERAALIKQAYANSSQRQLTNVKNTIENHAATMADRGTKVLRNVEDLANDVQFRQKPEKIAKFVDAARVNLQRDQAATLLQDTKNIIDFWGATAAKGGAEGAITTIRKNWQDTLDILAKADELGAETLSKDLFIRMDRLKRSVDHVIPYGRESLYGAPEAITHQEMGLKQLADKLRTSLEDAEVWGQAGKIQSRGNETFSTMKARRDHFMSELGVSIDQTAGIRVPEVDFAKARGVLKSLKGGENDALLQSVKSVESTISGFRDRAAFLREFGDLTEAEASKLAKGLQDLDDFEKAFATARKDAAVANRLEEAVLEERNASSVGGLLGLATGVVTQPLTTVQRLAQIRQTVQRTEEAIAGGLRRFFGGDVDTAVGKIAEKLKPRAKAEVAKEIGDISALRGNPPAMQDRASRMVGDLHKTAPKVAREVELTAIRALDYLAREAPRPSVPMGLVVLDATKARYSDQQISEWEAKKRAAFDPESVVRDMKRGKLNRDAIQAVEFVSPKLFAMMQQLAQEQIATLAEQGKLDKMPYQQKAVIATLLKVPADQTWTPDFISMMQAAKVTPVAQSAPKGPQQPNSGVSKRAVKFNTDMFATESAAIEQGGT